MIYLLLIGECLSILISLLLKILDLKSFITICSRDVYGLLVVRQEVHFFSFLWGWVMFLNPVSVFFSAWRLVSSSDVRRDWTG